MTVCDIGYVGGEFRFDADAVGVLVALDKQSPDIARGVDASRETRTSRQGDPYDQVGAGDQGMMFGYATNETPELMPMPITLAHRLARRLTEVRATGLVPYLRPDGKTQVTVRYDSGGRPVQVEKLLISAQHAEGAEDKLPDALWEHVATQVLPAGLYDPADLRGNFYVNPTGRFVIGGPVGDAGVTGRKIIVDTYGGFARHGGGAFSGRIPRRWTAAPRTRATPPERRGRRACRPGGGPGRLRDRGTAVLAAGGHVRHGTVGGPRSPAWWRTSTCAGRDLRSPRPSFTAVPRHGRLRPLRAQRARVHLGAHGQGGDAAPSGRARVALRQEHRLGPQVGAQALGTVGAALASGLAAPG